VFAFVKGSKVASYIHHILIVYRPLRSSRSARCSRGQIICQKEQSHRGKSPMAMGGPGVDEA